MDAVLKSTSPKSLGVEFGNAPKQGCNLQTFTGTSMCQEGHSPNSSTARVCHSVRGFPGTLIWWCGCNNLRLQTDFIQPNQEHHGMAKDLAPSSITLYFQYFLVEYRIYHSNKSMVFVHWKCIFIISCILEIQPPKWSNCPTLPSAQPYLWGFFGSATWVEIAELEYHWRNGDLERKQPM